MPIGRRLGHRISAQVTPGAGAVFDDDLTQDRTGGFRKRTGCQIQRPAGRIGHDQSQRTPH